MSLIPTITVTPGAAARDYGEAASGGAAAPGSDFGAALQRAVSGAIDAGQTADQQAMAAIAGQGNLTDVVTAVTHAELALQTATAIRDRFVQAYQDIMQMPM
jgi:flagellar hook-basal body complex protein FliE